MKKIVLTVIISAGLFADSLEEIINYALLHNQSIAAIENLLKQKNMKIKRSGNLDNPFLKIGINDIRVDDFSNRSLEPMQTNYILFKQKIPFFGKRAIKKNIAKKEANVAFCSLKEAQSQLVTQIKEEVIRYAKNKELLKLNQKYEIILNKLINTFSSYIKSGKKSHIAFMKSELLLSNIKIKKEKIENKLKKSIYTLSYLSSKKIKRVDFKIKEIEIPPKNILSKNLIFNPKIKTLKEKLSLNKDILKLAIKNKNSDFTFEVGYFQREKFKDYLSIAIGFSLPLYKTENIKIEEQKAKNALIANTIANFNQKLKSDLSILFEKYERYKKIIEIIKKETLPKIDHILNIQEAKIINGKKTDAYFNTLLEKISLSETLISLKAEILLIKAKIDNLTGAIQ